MLQYEYARDYCICSLQLLYTGSGLVFGSTVSDVPKGEWKEVVLPDKNVKVSQPVQTCVLVCSPALFSMHKWDGVNVHVYIYIG